MARARNEWQPPDQPGTTPFRGARIAISTAPETRALAALLEQAGAVVHRIEQGAESASPTLEPWLAELIAGGFDDVVFFTAQGVRVVCELASQLGNAAAVVDALKKTRLVAQ